MMKFSICLANLLSGLHQKHIEWSDTTNSWQITKVDVVRAKIDSDLESDDYYGHPPLIVIDGKEIK